jgi:transcriptional regulator with XRE-family HTH domain
MSQKALAEALGVTFQQVQKYETGANRLSASRLHAATRTLDVPIAWFFEGLVEDVPANDVPAPPGMAFTSQGLELAALVSEIPESQVRRRLLQLVRTLAEAARLARDLKAG